MDMNVYTGKTVEEAIEEGLKDLAITREQAEVEVLEEGKKGLFHAAKARVRVTEKKSDGVRATAFIDGLFEILRVNAVTELVSDGEKIEINITSTDSNKVIGRHGEVLDAIQCLAGAVSNIGREAYRKVVVDCENYRAGREKALTELAGKLAKKAVERQRRVTLEPMNPYERRVIHAALANSEEVKTISCGKEPVRFVVIVPNNEKPYDGKKEGKFRGRDDRRDGRGRDGKFRGDRRDNRRGGERRSSGGSAGAPRAKKEIHFGTFLGNSGKEQ